MESALSSILPKSVNGETPTITRELSQTFNSTPQTFVGNTNYKLY